MSGAHPEPPAEGNGVAGSKSSSTHSPVSPSAPPQQGAADVRPPSPSPVREEPSVLKRIWRKLGINGFVFMVMVKPAIAATISMAIYQSPRVAVNYLNLGYVIIVVSITTVPILPRGKFLLNFFISVSLTCLGAAMVLLGQYAGIKARQHTTPAGASPAIAKGYNSSASAVNAIFLMFNIFAINVTRATRPVLSIPSIQYTIFVLVGFIYGPQQPTEAASQKFIKELLYSFLTGQAISAAVCLLIIPVSSRKVFFNEVTGFLQASRGLLRAQLAFVQVLEHSHLCEPTIIHEGMNPKDGLKHSSSGSSADSSTLYDEKVNNLTSASTNLLSLGAKLREDVTFAKREVAFGHLLETDIHALHQLLRDIMIPLSGLSTIADISKTMHSWVNGKGRMPASISKALSPDLLEDERKEWLELLEKACLSFETVVEMLDESIMHVLVLLKLVPAPKSSDIRPKRSDGDLEKGPESKASKYSDELERRIEEFRLQRTAELHVWAKGRGFDSVFMTTAKNNARPPTGGSDLGPQTSAREVLASKRLHIILYMGFLLYSVSTAILAMVRFAESKVEDGTMTKKHFVFPAVRTLLKWAKGIINGDESPQDIDNFDQRDASAPAVQLGDSFQIPKDPEHLPPRNRRQVWSNHLRKIPKFLESDAVSFGVRVTIATMSIGIMAFLKSTHVFFIQQRVVWCLVMVAIGMTPTTGSAVFKLLGNLTATLFGMVGAFINWYIVDQKTAGVIVFFCLFQMFYFYWAARYPRFLVAIVAGALTHVLIIGYELQVRVIGLKIATATGQPYYPIYELAPYRLLTVGTGVTVAYIWTIFPVPITEASVLRRDLGGSLFLLANYFSSVTATLDIRLSGSEGDASNVSSPAHRLSHMRHKLLAKQIVVLNSMRQNISLLAWEPRLGGDFPKSIYQELVDEVHKATACLTIIAYASSSFPTSSPWLTTFANSRSSSHLQIHQLISTLSLLSSSIRNAQPLPPYLKAPESVRLSDNLLPEGAGILDLSNVNEPGFRAVAVIEVAQMAVVEGTERILELVRELVGEVDFSFKVIGESERDSLLGGEEDV